MEAPVSLPVVLTSGTVTAILCLALLTQVMAGKETALTNMFTMHVVMQCCFETSKGG